PRQTLTLRANGQLGRAMDYRNVVVAWRNGAPVRLGEIARVVDNVENTRVAAFYNEERTIGIGIMRQPDANIVDVIDAIQAMLPSMRAQIPPAVGVEITTNASTPIRAAGLDVQEKML